MNDSEFEKVEFDDSSSNHLDLGVPLKTLSCVSYI